MARKKQPTPTDAFVTTLKEALKHFHDATWLGENSVLATPYFLGKYLQETPGIRGIQARGRSLQSIIIETAASMWAGTLPETPESLLTLVDEERQIHDNKGNRYLFLLLELRYLRQFFSPRTQPTRVVDMPDFVNVSSTRFFVHLEQAETKLGELLLNRIHPTFRLEHPQLSMQLVGREDIQGRVFANLLEKKSVAISGLGGIGKTSLGIATMDMWRQSRGFWYTFHPGLNDDFNSLLFSLGHFLSQWGRSSLWLQLLASQGESLNPVQAIGFLRDDLQTNGPVAPLFCFDEVDLLHTSGDDPRSREHIQLLEFLDSLRGLISLLLIGQRALVDTDCHYVLQALNHKQSEQLFHNLGVSVEEHRLQRICEYTNGTPRLLELYAALIDVGEDVDDMLQMPQSPSIQPLFNRLWKRLALQEKAILSNLAVFRTPAPRHVWERESASLDSLIKRGLVKADSQDGIALLPFFRQLVYAELPEGMIKQSHQMAAHVRAELAEYTAAAYHFREATAYPVAVQLWYAHKEHEIQRGQATAAREIFESIAFEWLKEKEQKQLKSIQNQLALLSGESERVLQGMEDFSWHPEEEISADVYRQWGEALANVGDSDAARQRYDDALTALARLSSKIVDMNHMRGQLWLRDADMQSAKHEALHARYQTEWLHGLIEYAQGNITEAYRYFQDTLPLAQKIGHAHMARTHQSLLMISSRQGHVDIAEEHAQAAMQYFEQIGDRRQLEGVRAELAGVYLNARQFERVITPAEQALRFFEAMNYERRIAATCNNLAEAYFEVGQVDKAKEYAFRVLLLEIPRAQPYARYTLGLVYEQEGNLEHAEAAFKDGVEMAQNNQDKFIEAYLHRVLGALFLRQKKRAQGRDSLANSIELFKQMGLEHEVTATEQLLDSMS